MITDQTDELLEEYKELSKRLNFAHRDPAFFWITRHLLSLGRPIRIVETGSLRPNETPEGDGQSTLLWDWILSKTGGQGITIDNNPTAFDYTMERVKIIRPTFGDSLWEMPKPAKEIDFVYLDSMDLPKNDRIGWAESALHHVGELALLWPRIAPGGLVAVDDCYETLRGKHTLINEFFRILGMWPVGVCLPVILWEKPVLSK